jgi:hypothetical protein
MKGSFLSHRVRIPNRPAYTDHVIPDPTLLQISNFNYLWGFWLCGFCSWKHLLETNVLSPDQHNLQLVSHSLATSVLTFVDCWYIYFNFINGRENKQVERDGRKNKHVERDGRKNKQPVTILVDMSDGNSMLPAAIKRS